MSDYARFEAGELRTGPKARWGNVIPKTNFLPVGIWKEISDTIFLSWANSQVSPPIVDINVRRLLRENGAGAKSRSRERCQVPGLGIGG